MRPWFALVFAGCGFSPVHQQQPEDGPHDDAAIIDGVPMMIDARRQIDAKPDAPPLFSVRYNLGGAQYTGGSQNPGTWLADTEPGGICGMLAGTLPAPTGTVSINGTTDFAIYNKLVYATPLDCAVPSLPQGTYTIRMLFAELSRGNAPCVTAATRVLTITVQGTVVEAAGDIGALGNGCAAVTNTDDGGGHAFDLSFPNIAINGTLSFEVSGNTANGVISAIEIVQTGS